MSDLADRPSRIKVITAFALVYVIWGSTYLAIRFAVQTIPPFLMAGTRYLIAGAILYGVMRLRGIPAPSRLNWRSAAIIGGLMLLGGNGGVSWAEQRIPSGVAALMVAAVPMWMVVIDWLRPGGNKPGWPVIVGVLLGLVGIVVLVGPGELADGTRLDPLGILALVIAPLAWGIGSVYTRHANLPDSSLMATAAEMLAGGGLLIVVATLTGEWSRLDVAAISLPSLLGLAHLIIFGSLVAFSAYVYMLKVSTPARAGTYAFVNPVVAVILGWLVASEPLSLRILAAGAIIVLAVALITSYQDRSGEKQQKVLPIHDEEQPAPADIK